MSRYYKIVISNEDGGEFATYTSFVDGKTDPGALHVELDIPTAVFSTPVGAAYVRIWGVPITVISQAKDFNGKKIKVYGGMQKGLPLANPQQAGLLTEGVITQGFGNWIAADQTLDLFIVADAGSAEEPKNIVLDWERGTRMGDAILTALVTAFPDQDVIVAVDDGLVQDRDEAGYWATLSQFAAWVKTKSIAILGGDYAGVEISVSGSEVTAYDAAGQAVVGGDDGGALEIAFNDLIGQPTWIGPAAIQVTCVMRADVRVGQLIRLPRTQVTNTQQGLSQYRDSSVFQGEFRVRMARHVGAYRQPNAASWVTVLDAYTEAQAA